MRKNRWKCLKVAALAAMAVILFAAAPVAAQAAKPAAKKPNVLVIWGDDIGYWNISAYNQGMMGYKTPNIDRIAKEGALFTDWYGQQSCTAGRSAFITGQSGFRTGNLKVGLPGAPEGLQARDVTLAQLLKAQGYMTAQFGKNHLGDLDEHLPTAHGFDEFMGSLYHLNAEEEFENPDYFKDPALDQEVPDPRRDPHLGDARRHAEDREHRSARQEADGDDRRGGHQRLARLPRQGGEERQAVLPLVELDPHAHQHPPEDGEPGQDRPRASIPTAWSSTTAMVGQLLDKLKELGLDENTIVMYSTDNGAEVASWPDGGTTPFRGEKNTNWEGGYRVPAMLRWPGVIQPGHGAQRHLRPRGHDPDDHGRSRRAGCEGAVDEGHEGRRQDVQGASRRLQHHRRARRQGAEPAPRVLLLQRRRLAGGAALRPVEGRLRRAARPRLRRLAGAVRRAARAASIFNLRADPFELAEHSWQYWKWRVDRMFLLVPAQQYVGKFLASFKEFPPSQKVGSFSLEKVLASLQSAGN